MASGRDPDAWEAVKVVIEHDFQHPPVRVNRNPNPMVRGNRVAKTRRCTRCELWEVPYSRNRSCLGRPLTVDELRRELADED